MGKEVLEHRTINPVILEEPLPIWVEAFLIDRKAQNLAKGSLSFYREKLALFMRYADGQVITQISQLTPNIIRRFLLWLEDTGHNPGGIHAAYRALRAFLFWWEAETEPDGWKNPIHKVKAPKVPSATIEPVKLETVQALMDTCKGSHFTAVRDRALLLFLLDTGARAAEVCAVNLEEVDLIAGAVSIRMGKGRKPRTVYLGQKARRALRAYLRQRSDRTPALWVTGEGERLTKSGLNSLLNRRAKKAGVKKPGLHDFRRAFALNFLRNGGDIYSLQRLMGHADLQVLRRYLAQTEEDLQDAHRRGSPVDHGLKGG